MMVTAIVISNGYLALSAMCSFMIVFAPTMGAIHWFYYAEVLTDEQFGLVATVHYLNGLEISLCSEYMMRYMGLSGMFLYYAIITSLGVLFLNRFIKETRGLSDKEKMNLYK